MEVTGASDVKMLIQGPSANKIDSVTGFTLRIAAQIIFFLVFYLRNIEASLVRKVFDLCEGFSKNIETTGKSSVGLYSTALRTF